MRQYDDETLGAYLDGELDRATVATLEADLAADAELRERLADLRAINAVLRQWSVGLVNQQETPWPSAPVTPRRRFHRPAMFGSRTLWSHALAACLALVFGVGIGQFVDISARRGNSAEEATQRLLQAALEHTMSGQSVSWADPGAQRGVTVEPLRTYRADNTFCREYRETAMAGKQANERTMYGLACRDGGGTWNVEYTMAPGARALLVSQ
jgi:surface antigen